MIRPASHAGSWYQASPQALGGLIQGWLAEATVRGTGRFGVAPHAGYSFCGPLIALGYASLDPAVKRIIIMGPSHYEAFRGFRTTQFVAYASPLGAAAVDTEVVASFHKAGVAYLSEDTDVEEHGIEMHVPVLRATHPQAKIVPLVFGSVGAADEKLALRLLGPFLSDPATAIVISSDFCHWGSRFGFTKYAPSADALPSEYAPVSRADGASGQPIWKSIAALDALAMDICTRGDAGQWKKYISETGNTICGQRPLGILLQLAADAGTPLRFRWHKYAQSSQVTSRHDSSVSYASGVATL